MVDDIQLNPFQTGFSGSIIVSFNSKDQVFVFNQAVVSLCQLVAQHLSVFLADIIKSVLLLFNVDGDLVVRDASGVVIETELDVDGTVEIIKKLTILIEDRALVFLLS